CPGRARCLVCRLHVAPEQLDRATEVTDGIVYHPQAIGCCLLQGAVAEFDRERESPLTRCQGAVEVSRYPEDIGHRVQHPSQPGAIVERPGQGLGLAQQGEASSMLSQCEQRAIDSETEIDGQPPRVVVLGQVCEGLEGLVEEDYRLAERGVVMS